MRFFSKGVVCGANFSFRGIGIGITRIPPRITKELELAKELVKRITTELELAKELPKRITLELELAIWESIQD